MSYSAELKNGISEEVAVDPYIAIVQDADRLDAIGAIGICRCMVYSGANGRPIVSEGGEEEMKLRRKYAKKSRSAVAHFYEKLLQLKESMKTRTGGEMAEERHQFMLQFLDQLFDEVKGVK
ncbi:conserved hypothetical protein [Perkinsus marinus ATCC 50983]|uniref:HD domain-containing protein n=1 Tax=Perkinsus marinus (strain ATCC 50983 / TXsc) TaxID=423536 RepID=C5KPI6_PERM5|nr:conserved hypothetical protein [Perkinsus marinus ATCC 50983]EER13615.1 conserved hypothetical protein [Perkinsus marinus ATCC 50983]|eukprot:XP_002781820.1 conserved hypothetical protein [Perkinsus marinus ATCC 50983]